MVRSFFCFYFICWNANRDRKREVSIVGKGKEQGFRTNTKPRRTKPHQVRGWRCLPQRAPFFFLCVPTEQHKAWKDTGRGAHGVDHKKKRNRKERETKDGCVGKRKTLQREGRGTFGVDGRFLKREGSIQPSRRKKTNETTDPFLSFFTTNTRSPSMSLRFLFDVIVLWKKTKRSACDGSVRV